VEGPICVLWKAKRIAAWYGLSDEDVAGLLVKDSQSIRDLGGRNVISCDSRGSSAPWEWFGIDDFPTFDAHLNHIDFLEEHQFFRYWMSSSRSRRKW
jgi:hypothetical protein